MADRVLVLLNDLSPFEYSLLKIIYKKVFSYFDVNILYVKPINSIYALLGLRAQEEVESEDVEAMDSLVKQMLSHSAELFNCDESHQWIAAGKVRYEADKLAHKLHANYLITSSIQADAFKKILNHQKYSRSLHIYSVKEFAGLQGPRASLTKPNFREHHEPVTM